MILVDSSVWIGFFRNKPTVQAVWLDRNLGVEGPVAGDLILAEVLQTRIHVHVAHPDGEAKFWLTPDVDLAVNVGLSPSQVRQAQAVVVAHLGEIEDAWHRHFGS